MMAAAPGCKGEEHGKKVDGTEKTNVDAVKDFLSDPNLLQTLQDKFPTMSEEKLKEIIDFLKEAAEKGLPLPEILKMLEEKGIAFKPELFK
jgi:hypothetical protein